MPIIRAISIRQPYVEQILRGDKRFERRSRPTRIRGRVFLYASKRSGNDPIEWRRLRRSPGDLPVGQILGSVEIVGCRPIGHDDYKYLLKDPRRLSRPKRAKNQPQPIFWKPKF